MMTRKVLAEASKKKPKRAVAKKPPRTRKNRVAQPTEKDLGGRPLKFPTAADLQQRIDEYFASCFDYKRDMYGARLVDKDHPDNKRGHKVYVMQQVRPFTVTGLAVYLDTTRDVLIDYETGKYDDKDATAEDNARYSNAIKRAKARIYAYVEEQLFMGKQAAGPIFSLKNNYGWKDKSEVDNQFSDGIKITWDHDSTPADKDSV